MCFATEIDQLEAWCWSGLYRIRDIIMGFVRYLALGVFKNNLGISVRKTKSMKGHGAVTEIIEVVVNKGKGLWVILFCNGIEVYSQ